MSDCIVMTNQPKRQPAAVFQRKELGITLDPSTFDVEEGKTVTWSLVTSAKVKYALGVMKARTGLSQKDMANEALRQWIIANGGDDLF